MYKKILSLCLSVLVLCTISIPIKAQAQEATSEVTKTEQPNNLLQAQSQTDLQTFSQVKEEGPQEDPTVVPQPSEQTDQQLEKVNPLVSSILYSYVSSCFASLSIQSDGTVCESAFVAGYPSSVTSITGFLYLERKVGTSWVTENSCFLITYSSFLNMNNYCTVNTHATYRLRLRAYVYSGSNCEIITYYSSECTY